MKRTNETYEVEIASPLLRPGITVRTRVSKKYLSVTVKELLDIVREINVAEDKCPKT